MVAGRNVVLRRHWALRVYASCSLLALRPMDPAPHAPAPRPAACDYRAVKKKAVPGTFCIGTSCGYGFLKDPADR